MDEAERAGSELSPGLSLNPDTPTLQLGYSPRQTGVPSETAALSAVFLYLSLGSRPSPRPGGGCFSHLPRMRKLPNLVCVCLR